MLDVRTLYVLQFLILIVASILMTQVYLFNRHRFRGLLYWALMMIFSTLGILMIAIRGFIPNGLSIVLSNLFLYSAIAMIHIGIRRFFGASRVDLSTLIITSCAMFLSIIFSFVIPSIVARTHILSLLYVVFSIRTIIFLVSHHRNTSFRPVLPLSINLGILGTVNLYRIITMAFYPYDSENIFDAGILEIMYLIMMTMTMFYLLFNMFMVVSNKLYAEVLAEEKKFNKLFHESPTASIITRFKSGEIVEVNQAMLDLLGFERSEVIGEHIMNSKAFISKNTRENIIETLSKYGSVHGIEIDLKAKNESLLHTLYSSVLIEMRNETYVMSSLEDITEIYTLREKLNDLATHDFLTHLPNRDQFIQFFENMKKNPLISHQQAAVAMIDFDDFKSVNDNYGHDAGDFVLIEIAKRLERALYARGIATRYGGDEFAILILSGHTHLELTLRKLHDDLIKPVTFDGYNINVPMSIGVVFYPDAGEEIASLLKKADAMLYKSKNEGKNRIIFQQS